MMKNSRNSIGLTNRETVGGISYLIFQMVFLPGILSWANGLLESPLPSAELNFVFYLINFMAMLVIFHDFLGRSAGHAIRNIIDLVQAVILGLVAYYACSWATEQIIGLLVPSFSNYNDEAIAAMSQSNRFLVLIGTVVLVPPVEECLYRGLIFRNLYGKSKVLAYIASILAFAMIHILGYLHTYQPLELVLAFLQYLPAGLWLAWAYTKAGTVFAPIFIHAVINFMAIRGLR